MYFCPRNFRNFFSNFSQPPYKLSCNCHFLFPWANERINPTRQSVDLYRPSTARLPVWRHHGFSSWRVGALARGTLARHGTFNRRLRLENPLKRKEGCFVEKRGRLTYLRELWLKKVFFFLLAQLMRHGSFVRENFVGYARSAEKNLSITPGTLNINLKILLIIPFTLGIILWVSPWNIFVTNILILSEVFIPY